MERVELDRALAAGGNIRALARLHGLSPQALGRHRDGGHVPAVVRAAAADKEADSAGALLAQVQELTERASAILRSAKQPETKLRAIDQVRRTLELIGRLTGQLQSGASVSVQVGIWQRLGVRDEAEAVRKLEAVRDVDSLPEAELAARMAAWLGRYLVANPQERERLVRLVAGNGRHADQPEVPNGSP